MLLTQADTGSRALTDVLRLFVLARCRVCSWSSGNRKLRKHLWTWSLTTVRTIVDFARDSHAVSQPAPCAQQPGGLDDCCCSELTWGAAVGGRLRREQPPSARRALGPPLRPTRHRKRLLFTCQVPHPSSSGKGADEACGSPGEDKVCQRPGGGKGRSRGSLGAPALRGSAPTPAVPLPPHTLGLPADDLPFLPFCRNRRGTVVRRHEETSSGP